jgi:hypothetical protein
VSVNEAKYPSTHSPIHVIKDRPSSSCDIPFQQFEIKDSSVTNQSGYCFSIFFSHISSWTADHFCINSCNSSKCMSSTYLKTGNPLAVTRKYYQRCGF